MLVESLGEATVELQGFRVRRVTGDVTGLAAELTPDWRYAPRCGRCEHRGRYRDTRWARHFRHVPRRCCTNSDWPARCPPTGSSLADTI